MAWRGDIAATPNVDSGSHCPTRTLRHPWRTPGGESDARS